MPLTDKLVIATGILSLLVFIYTVIRIQRDEKRDKEREEIMRRVQSWDGEDK